MFNVFFCFVLLFVLLCFVLLCFALFCFVLLLQICEWCLEIGIEEITVYGFSIENFKRPEREVKVIMDIAAKQFERMLNEEFHLFIFLSIFIVFCFVFFRDWVNKNGVSVKVIGETSLLRKDLQIAISKSFSAFKKNATYYFLSFFFKAITVINL